MDWQKLLSTKRLGAEDSDSQPRPGRTEFVSDIDRIVFCSAFRRLGKKTQVHPLAPNDHVHTRLTHSLEVSRVGKALGKELGNQLRQSGDKYIPNETFLGLMFPKVKMLSKWAPSRVASRRASAVNVPVVIISPLSARPTIAPRKSRTTLAPTDPFHRLH